MDKQIELIVGIRDCPHERTKYEKSDGKIERYKETCLTCGRYLRWLPNVEAKELGLKFNDKPHEAD